MNSKKKILVCPLNWGLGHATRMVPVIRLLLNHQFDVYLAASKESKEYLTSEFPDLIVIDFPGYTVRYSKRKSQILQMARLLPRIIFWTFKEHFLLQKIIKKKSFDLILSDHRFGLWNKRAYCIFVSHQQKVKFPPTFKHFEFVYTGLLGFILKRYDECWVPDFKGEKNLSGELSHGVFSMDHIHYIGPLSRFSLYKKADKPKEFDVLFILSGPEPQRTIFEQIILQEVKKTNLKAALVRGTNRALVKPYPFPVYDMANTNLLLDLINKTEIIICRSGYSSVMDLISLKKRAVLVPTPGQTEQEYLADYLKEKELFYAVSQKNFDLQCAVEKCFKQPELEHSEEKENSLIERIKMLNKQNN
jgi:uncharacterized protein (TIGR00661 family)